MKADLESYEPIGNEVLLKISTQEKTSGGIHLPKVLKDRWMEVAKTGSLVTSVEPGDLVLTHSPDNIMAVKLTFSDEPYLQVSEHAIIGKVPIKKALEMNVDFT